MLRVIILSAVVFALTVSFAKGIDYSEENYNEDYGCIHENHSQYDDGDGLNLEVLNSLN